MNVRGWIGVAAGIGILGGGSGLPVTALCVGTGRIELGGSTFAAVARLMGRTEMASAGDAGDSRREACYELRGSPRATLRLESGELGGGERIEGFALTAAGAASVAEDAALAERCAAARISGAEVRTDRRIGLGTTRRDVEARIGAPSQDSAGVAIYARDEHRRGGEASSRLRIRYAGARAVAIAGWYDVAD